MKVLVTLPNSTTTYCVECDAKAIGREVLEKVCHEQNIHCETEYFGLVFHPRRTPSNGAAALSSPNGSTSSPSSPLQSHAPAAAAAAAASSLLFHSEDTVAAPHTDATREPATSALEPESPRVKQWLNLRNPLGRSDGGFLSLALRVKFWVPVHVILQDSVRNLFFMEARQDLLENRMFARDWTNVIQLAALIAHADGVRFDPSCLQVDEQLLSSAPQPQQSKVLLTSNGLSGGDILGHQRRRGSKRKSSEPSVEPSSQLRNHPLYVYEPYTTIKPNPRIKGALSKEQLMYMIAKEHQKYAEHKIKSAKYWLLSELAKLEGFGEERFLVPKGECASSQAEIAVGPAGIVHTKGDEKIEIPFSAIQRASSKSRTFRLKYLNQANKDDELTLKMPQPQMGSALYRAVTEKHDFYSCETVRRDVTTQFIRDFKGTIFSIFNEDTELGKKYVFDIQRTCREVHDHARRILHSKGILPIGGSAAEDGEDPATDTIGQPKFMDDLDMVMAEKERQLERSRQIQAEVQRQIAEAVLCRICMDKQIDAMFTACGHVVSCMGCANQCERCPMCRTAVTTINKIYLPTELRTAVATK